MFEINEHELFEYDGGTIITTAIFIASVGVGVYLGYNS